MSTLTVADAEWLAPLHAECFTGAERWSAATFSSFLADNNVFATADTISLVLCRQMGEEAELLTICTSPAARGQGHAKRMLDWALEMAQQRGVKLMHLEVAEDNPHAQKLYISRGFSEVGRRPQYYLRAGQWAAALLLQKVID